MTATTKPVKERIALFDLDGSLVDYDGAMRKALKRIMAPGERFPPSLYYAGKYWNRRMDLIKSQPGFWSSLTPLLLGVNVYGVLVDDLGYRPVVLTKGPYRTVAAWSEKVAWCRKHLPEAQVTITEDKGLVYGTVLYDDWPPYIERWLRWRPRGKVLMRSTRYNQGFKHPQVLRLHDNSSTPHTRFANRILTFLEEPVS